MESEKMSTHEIQSETSEDIEKAVDEMLRVEKWRSFVSGKMTGGLAVLEVLDIDREERISIMSKALGLSEATATTLVNDFYEERDS